MEYRHLGKQGLCVSALALDSWMTNLHGQEKQDLAAFSLAWALSPTLGDSACSLTQ
ncbi:hypothetical protein [Schleiferilactobacillus harbinensis]|uniref:hypothetical protein n=1 Tax=Schleiferilactobacillus harbinensis TaxID=304207 RepID=UPI00345E3C5F